MAGRPAGTAAAVVVWILGLVHLVTERAAARSVLLDHRRVLHRFLFELPQPSAGVARQFRNFAGRFETTGRGKRRVVLVENARGSAELVTQPSEGRVVASVTTTRLLGSFLEGKRKHVV